MEYITSKKELDRLAEATKKKMRAFEENAESYAKEGVRRSEAFIKKGRSDGIKLKKGSSVRG